MEPLPQAEAEDADMLSSLPAHLLDEILTRLDLRDAVRTSVLSCAWRRRWESLPGLALCFPEGTRPSVITRVLLRYTGPRISRFASYIDDDKYLDHHDWLIALSRRSVESICIFKEYGFYSKLTLHSSIFSCDRLVCLNLEKCCIPSRPRSRFTGFPVLQELYLRDVDFPDNGERDLQAIIRGSPLLRVLVLEEVHSHDYCVIEAPNLQTLVVGSLEDDGWRFGNLPCLQYVSSQIQVYRHGDSEHRLQEFFAGVCQVRELVFSSPDELNGVMIDKIPITFHNLKSLETEIDFLYMESILLLFSLLRSSPNLQKLKIEIRDWDPEWSNNWDTLSEQWTDGMCANLQVVQINLQDVQINSNMQCFSLSFMKLILSNASLLRTLSLDVCPVSQEHPLNELLNCSRASAQAKVLFKEDLPGIQFGVRSGWV